MKDKPTGAERKPGGRPRLYTKEDLVLLRPRLPIQLYAYLVQVARIPSVFLPVVPLAVQDRMRSSRRQVSVTLLFEYVLRSFLHARPYDADSFRFDVPRRKSPAVASPDAFGLYSVHVPKDLAEQIFKPHPDAELRKQKIPAGGLCLERSVSVASVLYSACVWFIKEISAKRRVERQDAGMNSLAQAAMLTSSDGVEIDRVLKIIESTRSPEGASARDEHTMPHQGIPKGTWYRFTRDGLVQLLKDHPTLDEFTLRFSAGFVPTSGTEINQNHD